MRRKPIKVTLLLSLVLLSACVIGAYAVLKNDSMFELGKNYKEAMDNDSDTVVATYNGYEITQAMIDSERKTYAINGEVRQNDSLSDRKAVENIIRNIMIVEKAEELGLAATNAEIEEMISAVKESYDIPEGKEIIDAYCAGAEISVETYFGIVEERAPRIIARQKLRDYVGQQYCIEHGIEFTKVNPPAEVLAAEQDYIEDLFAARAAYIDYIR